MEAHITKAENWVESGYHPIQVERVFEAFPRVRKLSDRGAVRH
jgi:hypothetical protein